MWTRASSTISETQSFLPAGIRTSLDYLARALNANHNDWLADAELEELERDAALWVKFFYPGRYSRPFTAYQKDFYKFIASIKPGKTHQPRVECEPRGVGKCLSGDTMISLANGTRQSIRDISIGTEIVSYNPQTGKFEKDFISNKWQSGVKKVFSITTKSNKNIRATAEHRVLTFDGWKRVDELTLEDRIASPRVIPNFYEETKYTDEAVRLAAYMIAEGCTVSNACTFTNSDKVIVDDFYYCASVEKFSVKPGRDKDRKRYSHNLVNGGRVWAREHGLVGKKSIHKRVPDWIFTLPKGQKWQFLSALIDTDGWISKNGRLGISLANKLLIEDIQSLFLQVGVVSFVLFKKNDKNNAFELIVDQECLSLCGNNLTLKLKNEKLKKILKTHRYSLLDTYPYKVIQNSGLTRKVRKAKITRIDNKYDVTRGKLRTLIAFAPEQKEWQFLESSEVLWEKIRLIEEGGETETFDVEVFNNHNLVTNNLITHNSSNLRAAIVYLLAKKIKFYVLIVSATDSQAKKHFNALRRMLQDKKMLRHYPHLNPQKSEHRNAISNWSAQRLVTAEGQAVEFVSILGNARGFNTEEGLRLDLIAVDDIDDQKDSVDVTEKKLDILGSNILGAGDSDTDVIFAQNLIHRTSVCTRLRDNTAGILLNRHFVGPFPLCKSYKYEEVPLPGDTTGAKQYVITDFQPFDEATSKEYAEILLNRLGYKRFERECQQNLAIIDDDKDFREYSEIHHIVTYSEFLAYFQGFGVPVWNRERSRPQIPGQWNCGLGQDWGASVNHPAAIFPVARPNKNVPLSDCFFVFGEVVMPEYPGDVNRPSLAVSPRKVAMAEREHLKKWNVHERQIVLRRMSHEASAALNAFAEDLEDDLKVYYSKWKAQKGSGVPQMQQCLEIDYARPHAFRRYPDNYPDAEKRGRSLMGMPRLLILVPDEQGRLMCEPTSGHLYVSQPYNAEGCARLRAELPVYNHRHAGKSKIFDDMVDAGRGMMGEFVVMAQGLTKDERFQKHLRENIPHLQQENIDRVEDPGRKSALIQAAIFAYEEFETAGNPGYERDQGFNDHLREMAESARENDWREM